jgi:hypothetical protein
MGLISDLKELSAWLISILSLVILFVLVFTQIGRDKSST